MYFRLRLDASPEGGGGQGLLAPFGWGALIDTNNNAGNYEWSIMVNGISNPETITLWQNTVQGTLGSPTDSPEINVSSITASGNIVISAADTSINGNLDYFLDWRFPYSTFKTATGLNDNSIIRMWFGSSNNGTVLSADLVAGTDLYTAVSDPVTLISTTPTTGSVMFVSDLAGNGDVTQSDAGANLFVKVTDADRNRNSTTLQTVTVTLTSTQGESETITLTETGVNTGVFTGAIATSSNWTPVPNNGTLQVMPGGIITASYIDEVDANSIPNQIRTDTVLISPPIITVTKTVDPLFAASGETATYTVTITNSGAGDGWLVQVVDILPAVFQYESGSTSGFTTSNPSVSGQTLTWNGLWTVPKKVGMANGTITMTFRVKATGPAGAQYNQATASGWNFGLASTGNTAPITLTAPSMQLTKFVSASIANPGAQLVYSVKYKNLGNGVATNIEIVDYIPPNTAYVPGSMKIGAANSNYDTPANTSLTDADDGDVGKVGSGIVNFLIPLISADDGVPDSGTDEGIVYFKVTIN